MNLSIAIIIAAILAILVVVGVATLLGVKLDRFHALGFLTIIAGAVTTSIVLKDNPIAMSILETLQAGCKPALTVGSMTFVVWVIGIVVYDRMKKENAEHKVD